MSLSQARAGNAAMITKTTRTASNPLTTMKATAEVVVEEVSVVIVEALQISTNKETRDLNSSTDLKQVDNSSLLKITTISRLHKCSTSRSPNKMMAKHPSSSLCSLQTCLLTTPSKT
jgi:hypothetical protein